MYDFRFASVMIAFGATIGLASPSFALIALHLPGSGFHYGSGGGMHAAPKPQPAPTAPMHMSGGGSMSGACCHMNGGYGGHTSAGWGMGGKPPSGMHPMGMHFYGMGGGAIRYGSFKYGHEFGGHAYGFREPLRRYGLGYGGHSSYGGQYGIGAGGQSYGMGGSYQPHMPSGSHMMGMHYYGMGSGSLAAKYGKIERIVIEKRVVVRYGYERKSFGGSYAGGTYYEGRPYGGSHGLVPQKTWGPPVVVGFGPVSPPKWVKTPHGYRGAFHLSYKAKYAYRYSYGSHAKRVSNGGTWGYKTPSSTPSSWTYAAK